MTQKTTRVSLLSRVRDPQDQVAWTEFDALYRELILRYCQRRGLQPADAEDVRQMVMLNLARNLRSFQYDPSRGRFRDYLGRTVANAIHRTRRSPRPELSGLETGVLAGAPAEESPELDQEWEAEWMEHHYRRAMETVRSQIEPKSLEVFTSLLAGEGIDEVAVAQGMTRDAVHKVKQRVRDRLKACIAAQVLEDEGPDALP